MSTQNKTISQKLNKEEAGNNAGNQKELALEIKGVLENISKNFERDYSMRIKYSNAVIGALANGYLNNKNKYSDINTFINEAIFDKLLSTFKSYILRNVIKDNTVHVDVSFGEYTMQIDDSVISIVSTKVD